MMAVRPFFIEASISGRQTTLAGGPRAKSEGQTIHLYQREKGAIKEPFTIKCYSRRNDDDTLTLYTDIYHEGELLISHSTQY